MAFPIIHLQAMKGGRSPSTVTMSIERQESSLTLILKDSGQPSQVKRQELMRVFGIPMAIWMISSSYSETGQEHVKLTYLYGFQKTLVQQIVITKESLARSDITVSFEMES